MNRTKIYIKKVMTPLNCWAKKVMGVVLGVQKSHDPVVLLSEKCLDPVVEMMKAQEKYTQK